MNYKEREFRERPEVSQPMGDTDPTANMLKVPSVMGALESQRETHLQMAADLSKVIQALKRHPDIEEALQIARRYL
jgi:hypothetical protein